MFFVLPFLNLKYTLFFPANLGSVAEASFKRGKNCVIVDFNEEALLTTRQNLEEYMLKGNDSNDAWQLWPKMKWIQCQYVNKSLHWICMKLLLYYAFLLTYSCLLGTPHREFKMAANEQEMVLSLLNHATRLLSNNRSNNTNQQEEKTFFPILLPESSWQLQIRSLYFTLIYVKYICLCFMPCIEMPLCVMPFCMLPHCVTSFCIMPLCVIIYILSVHSHNFSKILN